MAFLYGLFSYFGWSNEEHAGEIDIESLIAQLMGKMREEHYDPMNLRSGDQLIYEKCKELFEKDYEIKIVENRLSNHYPKNIIVPVAEKDETNEVIPMEFDVSTYDSYANKMHAARVRSRIPVPVILLDKQFICRSGTLCDWKTAAYETFFHSPANAASWLTPIPGLVYNVPQTINLTLSNDTMISLYKEDGKLLRYLKVQDIYDLMVELQKVYKDLVYVASTEKACQYVYPDMRLKDTPYPGCEFFAVYSEASRNPEGLRFDWTQKDVNRELSAVVSVVYVDLEEHKEDIKFARQISKNLEDMGIKFPDFKDWDLVTLTANYLKIMLTYLVTGNCGMLVHCISGWDRTPVFISLLRMSLWADGVVHKTLDANEMAYLTLAYDWFLFGHDLPNRLKKKEEIMHFCFNFLNYITSDDFSITKQFEELPWDRKVNRSFPRFEPRRRREVLEYLRYIVLRNYNEHINRL